MTEKNESAPAKAQGKRATYVAVEDLKAGNGALAFAKGQEVPASALESELGKAHGWSEYVTKQ